ncbi:astacin [Dictyocaulus viviparus]|uniref:Zinc metalloproteinase n=1 Tax=Dictyocaulus viviparus TaxID=29172 RepID=A0A0D8X9K6_DICVI|nr:astacin [Dictyocaulus viviparus]
MQSILFPLLLLCIGVEFYGADALDGNAASDESYRKEIEEESQQLGNETDAENTKVFLEKLLSMEEKIEDELKLTPQRNEELNFTMRNYVDMGIDHVNRNGDSIEEVNEHNRIDKALYQSDMILNEAQTEEIIEEIEQSAEYRTKRQAMNLRRYPKSRWPNKRVYYTYVNASARAIMAFEQAVKDWSNATCIDFYQNDTEYPRIIVTSGRGCWSHVGHTGKKQQQLSLGRGCGTKNTASQFNKQSEGSNNNYNLTYDYGGVMHYGPMSVSKNRKPVVITRDINYMPTLGSPMISFYEKLMMNVHYQCNDCTKEPSAACQNGGFPHPRNCMICICPSGYGGDLCDRRPDGCGSVLKANESFQSLVDTVGVDTIPQGRAQPGEKIEVILDSYSRGFQVEGCKYAGVEIKTGSDKRYTGYRFCSPSSIGTRLVSTYNIVPIITYNLRRPSTTRLRYRSIRSDTDALESTSMPVTSTPSPRS